MEKRKPTYDLDSVKSAVQAGMVKLTYTCRQSIYALGGCDQDILDTIISLERTQFYKSMTSYADHRVWQDVYHVLWNDMTILDRMSLCRRVQDVRERPTLSTKLMKTII